MDLGERLAELVGATLVEEVHGGHQSRMFAARLEDGQRIVVKVLDASLVDRRLVDTRVSLVAELAALDSCVCAPVPLNGLLVTELELDDGRVGLVTGYEHATGIAPVAADPGDAELMGRVLAHLHASMRQLGARDLPRVAALDAVPFEAAGPLQLLHGDFNAGNLLRDGDTIRIFDFDDCGYGPASFDVANALYMVLFDDLTDGESSYVRSFEDAFVSGYEAAGGLALDRNELNGFIDLRVAALDAWLDDPATAPIGIRSAAPSWRATLRSFIDRYRSRSA